MDLELTGEQQMLRDALRSLCETYATPAVVRAAEREPHAADALMTALADMGVARLRIAPEHGGLGLGLTELAVAYHELGRVLAPGPHVESGVVSAALLSALADSDARAAQLLTTIADGAIIVTAWQDADGGIGSWPAATRLARDGDVYRADGAAHFVSHAAAASHLLVRAQHPDIADQAVLAVVRPSAPGIEVVTMPNLADASLATLHFHNVRVDAVLGLDGGVDAGFEAMFDEVLVAIAALSVGGAERILEMAIAYSCQREQFGRPIGSFQAIAHYLADAAVAVEGARALVYRAVSAADEGAAFQNFANMAKLQAGKVFRDVSATAIQIYGGIGFTSEADPQLFYRRAKHLQLMYGDPALLERRIGDAVLSPAHSVYA